ncbi:hypothetical protein [Kordiimonas laminariae]|uniref:hypothetical protein n=1 Tax=Kordiimonas laminariae TaxID=2917717 RepID=UPI001FF43C30|nr:hypothetical protein [Kordiimonas laminariae]MCK0070464.1 hypothetical protein [Kordiimonas laminariae]
MSGVSLSRVRLFPMLIGCAAVALTMRAVDIYTGVELLGAPVQAAQETEQNDNQPQEDQKPAAEQAEPAPQMPKIVGLRANEEEKLLTQLRQRRLELEQREKQLELQEQLLSSTEQRIEKKITQLELLEKSIKEQLRIYDERENEKLKAIVDVYEKMKPKDAAPRFEQLSLQTQVDLVTRMKAPKVAALMGKMTAAKASRLTTELATRAAPPDISDLQPLNQ